MTDCPPARQARAAALALALVLAGRPAAAQSWNFARALAQAAPDAACADMRVIGQCVCGGPLGSVPCGLRIAQFVPVAFVETTRAPGDSLLAAPLEGIPGAGGTASSALSATDNTAEVHVWALPGPPLPGLDCPACDARSAALPLHPPDPAAAACGPAAAVAQSTARRSAAFAASLPRLAYASELDLLNWRTGCRDLAVPADSAAAALRSIGAWGRLLPRQMRDIGPTPVLYSVKTAVRAMSIAREQVGSFEYPVDTAGKLQQAYPSLSACFPVGALPLPEAPAAARPVLPSPDGRYGWLYWRPAVCCLGPAALRQCLRTR